MFINFLKISLRHLLKNKFFSLINIVGLAIGMCVAILIGLWSLDEISFDHYHQNHKRLAQVMLTESFNGNVRTNQNVAIPLASVLRSYYGNDFKYVALASGNDNHIVSSNEKKVIGSGIWAQPDFPNMFTFKMVDGIQTGLQDPSSILLEESFSKTLFGNINPINKLLQIDNLFEAKVTGIYQDLPTNTTFHNTKFILPWNKLLSIDDKVKKAEQRWGTENFRLFVEMKDYVSMANTSLKIKDVTLQYHNTPVALQLHPMDKWHLYSEFINGKNSGGKIQFVWLFGTIGILVMLLACINFINLSTAKSEKRAKEVGIRKTVGSMRNQMIWQFLTESLLIAYMALILSLALVQLSLPFFNKLADKQVSFPWADAMFWLSTIAFTFIAGFLSGIYPAFYLSSFNPVQVLKGTFRNGHSIAFPRKVLVTVQFTISVALIIGTMIVFRQIQFAQNRPLGYSRQGLITVSMNTPEIYAHYDLLRNDLLRSGTINEMSESKSPTTAVWSNRIGFDWAGKDPNTTPWFGVVTVTHDFGRTIGWHIKEGRDFSRDFSNDTSAIILNESALQLTGLKDVVGKIIDFDDKQYKVIGVIQDMLMESPYKSVKPTIFFLEYGPSNNVITVSLKSTMPIQASLAKIKQMFEKYNPGAPFEYSFVDEEYSRKFSDERRVGSLSFFFSFLAIFISCIGIFGLTSFMAEKRTKEIGIRKVLGASAYSICKLISNEFIVIIAISCLIAFPFALFFSSHWLQQYVYRTPIFWSDFMAAGFGVLIITLLTISVQSVKAALANPIKSLRSE